MSAGSRLSAIEHDDRRWTRIVPGLFSDPVSWSRQAVGDAGPFVGLVLVHLVAGLWVAFRVSATVSTVVLLFAAAFPLLYLGALRRVTQRVEELERELEADPDEEGSDAWDDE